MLPARAWEEGCLPRARILLLLSWGWSCGRDREAVSTASPVRRSVLVVEGGTRTYDAGQVRSGARIEHQFRFRNATESLVLLGGATRSCGCTDISLLNSSLAPGEVGALMVTIDTTGKSGRFAGVVTVHGAAEHEGPLLTFRVSALIGREFIAYAKPAEVDLGVIGGQSSASAEIRLVSTSRSDRSPLVPKAHTIETRHFIVGKFHEQPAVEEEGRLRREFVATVSAKDAAAFGVVEEIVTVQLGDGETVVEAKALLVADYSGLQGLVPAALLLETLQGGFRGSCPISLAGEFSERDLFCVSHYEGLQATVTSGPGGGADPGRLRTCVGDAKQWGWACRSSRRDHGQVGASPALGALAGRLKHAETESNRVDLAGPALPPRSLCLVAWRRGPGGSRQGRWRTR